MSTASQTVFVTRTVDVCGHALIMEGNQKISGWDPVPNALSVEAVTDCPGSTNACRSSCYVQHMYQAQPALHAAHRGNRAALASLIHVPGSAQVFASEIRTERFRWHPAGDVFSADHARWIAAVCGASPHVQHWIYTRSFDVSGVLDELTATPNLTVNISADEDNRGRAMRAAGRYGLRVCWMARDAGPLPDLVTGDVIFPDYLLRKKSAQGAAWFAGLTKEQRRMVCPVDYFGKSRHIRCGVCKKCF